MKKYILNIFIVITFLLFQFNLNRLNAQTIVMGKVIDAISRQPIEAAIVSQSNAVSINTITDQYGNFMLKTTNDNSNLVATYIGYKSTTVDISGKNNIKIALQPDISSLIDVVVLTSNTQPKFASLAKLDLNLKPVNNSQELLRVVPGLFVAQHTGGGKAEQIFLRGFDIDHGTDIQKILMEYR